MLRMGYMPSDYHPQLLVLGTHAEVAGLARLLAAFAGDGASRRLAADGFVESAGAEVILTRPGPEARRGLWLAGNATLVWALDAEDAEAFAGEVAELARSPSPAGSATLECALLGEVKVQVSVGEWEDDVLEH